MISAREASADPLTHGARPLMAHVDQPVDAGCRHGGGITLGVPSAGLFLRRDLAVSPGWPELPVAGTGEERVLWSYRGIESCTTTANLTGREVSVSGKSLYLVQSRHFKSVRFLAFKLLDSI